MLIKQEFKKVLLNLKDPQAVLNLIPTAKTIEYKGKTIVVVPHKIEEVKLLANLGIDVPAPIEYYYDWPGFQPFEAQRVTAGFMTKNNRAYCLNDLGTGKTMANLWAWDFLRKEGDAQKLLVVAPLSTLDRVWADEIFRNFPELSFVVLHGSKQKRQQLLRQDVDVYIINHDGVKVLEKELKERTDIDSVIIDEVSQCARNAQTEMWRSLRDVCYGRKRVWGLTGTPIPNQPTDAWAQCRLITPETVPPYFSRYRDKVMMQMGQYKWVARPEALEVVKESMQPAIRFKRDDCVDLPPVMYEEREAPLTKEQHRMYSDMLKHMLTNHGGEQITAVNEAVKQMKLVQIACGAVYSIDGEAVVVPPQYRLDALLEVVQSSNSKTIVFAPFKSVLPVITDFLASHGYKSGVIHGGVSKNERDEIFHNFQGGGDIQVLVAQPAAMSHGLTLTAASTIAWFAPVTSAEVYEQANARITRPGQKHSQLIVNIQSTGLERKMYERLKQKVNTQGVLLDMIRKAA
jgi:SNF2 family DNA or RNA helicase